jgi:hypothetical protein
MADLVWVQWYATVLRQEALAAEVARTAPIALRYGASRYMVHVNNDDRYKINQFTWFENKTDWYRFWDGPEMIEFRARNTGRFQVPINYSWADEVAYGELGPQVPESEPVAPGPAEPSTPETPQTV